MINDKHFRIRCRQDLLTDVEIPARDVESAATLAELMFYEPPSEPIELGGRNVRLMDGQRIEGFDLLSIEEAYA